MNGKKKQARMFGLWQVPMTDPGIFSGAWSLCEPYRSFT
jgi:hypothetical protein